jgi:hypothetical protein
MVESTFQYSAKPPQTPPSLQSVTERVNRFIGAGGV